MGLLKGPSPRDLEAHASKSARRGGKNRRRGELPHQNQARVRRRQMAKKEKG